MRRALRALFVFLGLPFAACGATRIYVCSVDGADVFDFEAPSELGRVQIVRVDLYAETKGGKGLVLGCEGYKQP